MKTHLKELNEIVDFNKPQLIVLASRALMGKSTFALDILTNIACKQRISSFYIDLNMTRDKLLENLSKNPNLYETDMKNPKLHITNKPQMEIKKICEKCRQMKIDFDIKCVFIDDIQCICYDKSEYLSRDDEISNISNILKNLANELNITIFALSQLTNAPDKRTDHRPILEDLGNNELVENANVVMFLYRDDYYNTELDNPKKEIIIAKNQNGITKTIEWNEQVF